MHIVEDCEMIPPRTDFEYTRMLSLEVTKTKKEYSKIIPNQLLCYLQRR